MRCNSHRCARPRCRAGKGIAPVPCRQRSRAECAHLRTASTGCSRRKGQPTEPAAGSAARLLWHQRAGTALPGRLRSPGTWHTPRRAGTRIARRAARRSLRCAAAAHSACCSARRCLPPSRSRTALLSTRCMRAAPRRARTAPCGTRSMRRALRSRSGSALARSSCSCRPPLAAETSPLGTLCIAPRARRRCTSQADRACTRRRNRRCQGCIAPFGAAASPPSRLTLPLWLPLWLPSALRVPPLPTMAMPRSRVHSRFPAPPARRRMRAPCRAAAKSEAWRTAVAPPP